MMIEPCIDQDPILGSDPAWPKVEALRRWIEAHRPLMVAFSGGVDSAFLLAYAHRVLGQAVIAVTSIASIHPSSEIRLARQLAAGLGVRHLCIDTAELSLTDFVRNGPERCYVCKHNLFSTLRAMAAEHRISWIAHGATMDDANDYRPGQRAASELDIQAPLAAAALCKEEIRRLSRRMGLETWNRPAQACLASRIVYGLRVSQERIDQVAAAEAELARLGIRGGRVRHHGHTARIEVAPDHYETMLRKDVRHRLITVVKQLGFVFVTLDLEGYVAGSLNRILDDASRG